MRTVHHEVVDCDIKNIISDLEEQMYDVSDVMIIAFDGENPTFLGETGLMNDQVRRMLQILLARFPME